MRLLPVSDASEGAVLAFDEDAAVDQDLDQEAAWRSVKPKALTTSVRSAVS